MEEVQWRHRARRVRSPFQRAQSSRHRAQVLQGSRVQRTDVYRAARLAVRLPGPQRHGHQNGHAHFLGIGSEKLLGATRPVPQGETVI